MREISGDADDDSSESIDRKRKKEREKLLVVARRLPSSPNVSQRETEKERSDDPKGSMVA